MSDTGVMFTRLGEPPGPVQSRAGACRAGWHAGGGV